ncbi:MAG TPA: GspE/PulE family protein [Candidatus Saccharimonadales bacterium]|nr:GspE/PulE family protein [Candidatus Saccharimonadales bacterium]
MYPSVDKVKTILLKENSISSADSLAAEKATDDSQSYVNYLIGHDLLSKKLLGQALAKTYGLPFIDLADTPATQENIDVIPEAIARANRIVLVKNTDKAVGVVTDTADDLPAKKKKIQKLFPEKQVSLGYTLPEFIDTSFKLYEKPLETRFSQIISSGRQIAPGIVDEIVNDALAYNASDIHFEPRTKDAVIRFRVDGNLHIAGTIPKEYYENILNRLKVEGGMRIDEHFTPQDGAITREMDGRKVDLRIALMPTVEGEKVAVRILNSYVQDYKLTDIGLSEEHRESIQEYSTKPFGMILSVGPTGSGKTTTLYALLKLLNQPNVNITTMEDPVEYKIDGINQIQVREASNLTFAKGLRSIVRQDPNIILVGEIRDRETAEISVNAALTGHLMLSTFHANDAATAIPRLIDMGIEPFLLASTLEVVIAQRLVRKICSACRYSLPVADALKASNVQTELKGYFSPKDKIYAGKGCSICSDTGYSGRTALFEFIDMTPEMRDLIITNPASRQVEALARKQGNKTMFEDGILKVKNGTTTIEELVRVVEPPRKAK